MWRARVRCTSLVSMFGMVGVVAVGAVAAALSLAGTGSAAKVVLGSSFGSPFCSAGTGAGQCEEPQGIAVNQTGNGGVPAGDVYVADSGNDRIDQFSASGLFIQAWGSGVVASGPDDTSTGEAVSVAVSAAGGTFTLAYAGQTTPAIAYDATAAVVEADLSALSTIGGQGGSVAVSGGPGDETGSSPYVVMFGGSLKGVESSLVSDASGLSMAVGGTLRCTAGPTTAATTYQWLRNGASIAGATGSTYTTVSGDAGKTIQCQVFAIDSNAGATQVSSAVAVVSPFPATAPPTPPADGIVAPSQSGSLRGKGGQTLTCEPETEKEQWTGAPTFSYQWYRDGVALSGHGANTSVYTVQEADIKEAAAFQCAVTATNGGGATTLVSKNVTTATKPSPEAPVAEATMAVPVSVLFEVTAHATAPFQKCVPANGDTCRRGVASAAAGGLSTPTYPGVAQGVAVDQTNGNLYVTDQSNHRVDVFSATGDFEGAFGWGVVPIEGKSPEEELQFCTPATGCGPGLEGAGAGALSAPSGPAVDPSAGLPSSGNIYIADTRNSRIDEFHPTVSGGEVTGVSFVHAFGFGVADGITGALQSCTATCYEGLSGSGVENTGGELHEVKGVAVDSTGVIYALQRTRPGFGCAFAPCRVQKFNATGTSASEFAPSLLHSSEEALSATSIAVDSAGNYVYVAKGIASPVEQRVLEFESREMLLGEGGANAGLPLASGLAVGTGGRLYFSNSENDEVYILGAAPTPVVMISQPTSETTTSATLNGSVNPEGYETHFHFEYSTNGVTWISTAEVLLPGKGTVAEAVHQEVGGLTPGSAYLVRLVASNGTEATSSLESLNTGAAPPRVYQTLASPVAATSADLTAYIASYNSATTYHLEYGTTAAYGSRAPAFERNIGAGATSVPVAEPISGLQPSTEYHFRVVASNASGTTYGADEPFMTLGAEGSCPNEQVRSESDVNLEAGVPFSMQLPECRAYEMVTPALKNGSPVSSNAGVIAVGSTGAVARIGSEGSAVLIKSKGIWPGGEQPGDDDLVDTGAAEGVQYGITRAESGWEFKPEDPADLRAFASALLPNPGDMGGDISTHGIWQGAGIAPAEAEIAATRPSTNPNFYLLEPGGVLTEVGPSVPLSDQGGGVEPGSGEVVAVGGSAVFLPHAVQCLGLALAV